MPAETAPAHEAQDAGSLVAFSTRVSPELKLRLKVYAAKSGRSIIEVVETALATYLDDRGA